MVAAWAPDEHGNVGETGLANGMLSCWHCHRGMHEGGWKVTGDANGTLTFHDRDGRLLGASGPKKPDPKWVTQNGQEVLATRNRVTELLERMQGTPRPDNPPPDNDPTREPTHEPESPPDTGDPPDQGEQAA